MRAVIDIGSNSILLLLATRDADGTLSIARDDARVARLSEGAAERGSLSPAAIERALIVVADHVATATAHGVARDAIIAVATEGLRMVDNPDAFLAPAAELLGRPIRLLTGDEEARLSYLSVALEQLGAHELRVLDIGGASTELVVGRGREVHDGRSHAIGSVRFSERFVLDHPPSRAAVEAMHGLARSTLASQPLTGLPELHALAGTVTTCAGLLLRLGGYDRQRVDHSRFAVHAIRELRDDLATWTLPRLRAEPLLGHGRADLIVAGATILLASLEHCGAETLVVRDRGLRYALI